MKPTPAKIIELRNKNAMNQEALAGRAKVSVRTVQRAEAGEPIDLQTAQQIACALGVQPGELTQEATPETDDAIENLFENRVKVALLPTVTARALLDVVETCAECRLDHEVDVTPSAIDAAVAFCEAVGPTLPVLCPEVTSINGASDDPAQKLIARLRSEGQINECLERLKSVSVSAYAGTYIDWIKRPHYSIDDGMWLTSRNQRVEPVRFGIVRLGPLGRPQMTARVKVEEPPF